MSEPVNERKPDLVKEILFDFGRHKLLLLLALIMVISAFAVIRITHETRLLTAQQERLLAERDALDVEWRNLLLEQNSLEEHSRIAHLAQKKLGMQLPTVEQEEVVVWP